MRRRLSRPTVLLLGLLVVACGQSGAGAGPRTPPAATTPPGISSPEQASTGGAAPVAANPRIDGEIASGLTVPWGLSQLGDGSWLVTERDTAAVSLIKDGQRREVGRVPGVAPNGEGGLLGITHKPGNDTDLFVYFTAAGDNKVVRMLFDGNRLTPDKTLIEGIPTGSIHNGGRMAFGPDGYLYVATGDGSTRSNSQDPSSLGGKILRVDTEGNPAPGNPFHTRVWTLGHRNVQGLAWDESGTMYASEFGQNAWDEINKIQPGKNYGWPRVEGMGNDPAYTNPLHVWRPADASPSGIAYADGSIWMAGLRGQGLWQIPLNGRQPMKWFDQQFGRLRTVERGRDGRLYLVTSNTFRGEPNPGDDKILLVRLR